MTWPNETFTPSAMTNTSGPWCPASAFTYFSNPIPTAETADVETVPPPIPQDNPSLP